MIPTIITLVVITLISTVHRLLGPKLYVDILFFLYNSTLLDAGYELNVEPVMSSDTREYGSMVSVDADNVVIDWVKKAEDSEDVIVRLYESHGARGPVTLSFGDAPKQVSECDLMEENDETVVAQGNTVSFDITPWEIRTFKVRM